MATLKQMEFFQSLFLSEETRMTGLRDTAKTYLTLSTLYSAFVLFVTDKMKPSTNLSKAAFAATIVSILLAFLMALLVLQVVRYQAPSHPDLVFDQYGEDEPTDSDFFDNRIVDYSLAYEANSHSNDIKADLLRCAGAFVLLGLLCHASYFLLWIYCPGDFHA